MSILKSQNPEKERISRVSDKKKQGLGSMLKEALKAVAAKWKDHSRKKHQKKWIINFAEVPKLYRRLFGNPLLIALHKENALKEELLKKNPLSPPSLKPSTSEASLGGGSTTGVDLSSRTDPNLERKK
jgi:hypothetical protein